MGGGEGSGYTFTGDPREIFSQFFGAGVNPFEEMMGGAGGMGGSSFGFSSSGGMPGASNGFIDISQMMGGGMNGMGAGKRHERKEQDPPVEHMVNLSLEELYNGCTKKMKISRNVVAHGNRLTKDNKVVTIDVKPGWKAGTKITFPKEGDQYPGKIPSDVVFVIGEKSHEKFERDGNNLTYKVKVTLRKALCGRHKIVIPTIEGERIERTIDRVVDSSTVEIIKGHGMPISKSPGQRGDLLVKYDILFPKNLSDKDKMQLGTILSKYQ